MRGVAKPMAVVSFVALLGTAALAASNLQSVPRLGDPQYLTEISTTPHFAGVTNVVAADFTGDGLDDLLVTRATWPTAERYPVQLLVNDGAGHLIERTTATFAGHVPETVFPYRVVVADFNGDKVPDAFIADTGEDIPSPPGWQSQLILSAPGGHVVDGTDGLPQHRLYTYFADAADVNGDGTTDLYLGNDQSAPPQILLNDGQGHFHVLADALPRFLDPPANPTSGRFIDANRDGSPDLVVAGAEYSAPPNVFHFPLNTGVLLNDGRGHFSLMPNALPPKPFASTGEAVDMRVTDLNHDGISDLLIAWTKGDPYYLGRWIQVLIGNGNGTFRDETTTRLPQSDNVFDPIVGLQLVDLNRDGALDLATQLLPRNPPPFDPPPPFYLNDGNGSFTPLPAGDGTDAGEQFTFADLDGDGGHDVIYTKDAFKFYVRRDLDAPVSTLYGSIRGHVAALRTAEDIPLFRVRPGAYNVVVADGTRSDLFRLVGPSLSRQTTKAFVGRTVWRLRLQGGARYRFCSSRACLAFRAPR